MTLLGLGGILKVVLVLSLLQFIFRVGDTRLCKQFGSLKDLYVFLKSEFGFDFFMLQDGKVVGISELIVGKAIHVVIQFRGGLGRSREAGLNIRRSSLSRAKVCLNECPYQRSNGFGH
jgi:hypothetical protein